jgi:hypothetical protein
MFDGENELRDLFLLAQKYPHKKFVTAPSQRHSSGGYLWCAKCFAPKDAVDLALWPCLPHKWGPVLPLPFGVPRGARLCKLCGISNMDTKGKFCLEPAKDPTE